MKNKIYPKKKLVLFFINSTLFIYNVCSFSLYFISSVFFLNHLGIMSASAIQHIEQPANIYIIIIATVGCLLMALSQQRNMTHKAYSMIDNTRAQIKHHFILDVGIHFKSLVMISSFFALLQSTVSIIVSSFITIIVSYGVFYANKCTTDTKERYEKKGLIYALFIAVSYSACLSALYFNTMNHIILDILHQSIIHDNQALLVMPNTLFSIIFFIGSIVFSIQNVSAITLEALYDNYFFENIFSMLSGLCMSWKSLLNTLSFISLVSFFLGSNATLLFLISIPIFLITSFSQTIFFAKKNAAKNL